MDNSVAISVIIPVYNEEKFLPRCLNSVINQSIKNLEIICVNDGSIDNCDKILADYSAKDSRIKIVDQKNQGLSEARNHGIDVATGNYLFFLDADDYLHPQALEIFYNIAQKTSSPIVISQKFRKIGEDPVEKTLFDIDGIKYKTHNSPLDDLYQNRFISAVVWNKLYRRDTIGNLRFIKGIYFEDWPFTACLFSNIENFSSFNEEVYMYNVSSPSIVRSQFSIKKIQDYICGIYYVYDYFYKNKPNLWKIVQKKRISKSINMILSKISKSKENLDEMEKYFLSEYQKLISRKIVRFRDLSLKSKFRLLRIYYHQRRANFL